MFVIAGLVAAACTATDGAHEADGGTQTAESGGAEDDACTPGYEGCPCVSGSSTGSCLAGLVCLSELCVEPPMPPPSGDETTAESGADGSTSPDACSANEDCLPSAICWDGACSDAWSHAYEVYVDTFSYCMDDGFGAPEEYYRAYVDAELVYTSATSGCPPGWPTESVVVASFDDAFWIDFWELDAIDDDFLASLCWDTFGDGTCGPLPKSILHEGVWLQEWVDSDGNDRSVELELVAIE
jgi:hypothetical protein